MRFLLISLMLACAASAGAQPIRITGRIPCIAHLELLGGGALNRAHVSANSETAVVLSLRSNCAYRIQADAIGARVTLTPVDVSPAAGTANLTANALAANSSRVEIAASQRAIWLEGPRVSRAGNNSTAGNAILIRAVIQSEADADVVFTAVPIQ